VSDGLEFERVESGRTGSYQLKRYFGRLVVGVGMRIVFGFGVGTRFELGRWIVEVAMAEIGVGRLFGMAIGMRMTVVGTRFVIHSGMVVDMSTVVGESTNTTSGSKMIVCEIMAVT
jgi:hypothetical protein